jgi:hypothetical protein
MFCAISANLKKSDIFIVQLGPRLKPKDQLKGLDQSVILNLPLTTTTTTTHHHTNFSLRKGCPRVVKYCMVFDLTKKIRFEVKRF